MVCKMIALFDAESEVYKNAEADHNVSADVSAECKVYKNVEPSRHVLGDVKGELEIVKNADWKHYVRGARKIVYQRAEVYDALASHHHC